MQAHQSPLPANLTKALGSRLGSDIDEDDLRAEYQKYRDYGVPEAEAVRTILRHLGVQTPGLRPSAPVSTERILLANLPTNAPSVNLKARIFTINTKNVTARGEAKEILWGLLGDESGTAGYSSWRPLDGFAKGDVVEIQGAYTKEFNGQAQLNFGDRTRIRKIDAAELPPTPPPVREVQVADIQEGMRGIRLLARILDVAPRTITVQGAPKTVWGGHLADATGRIEFTAWSDLKLEPDAVIQLEGAYAKAFRGVAQLSFDEGAKITPFAGAFPGAAELASASGTTIGKLLERGGANDVTLVATLLEIKEGSGLIFRDPQTKRAGPSGPGMVPDLRIKGVLDDGTGAVSMVVGRDLTQALLGKDVEACTKEAQAAFRPTVIQEELRTKLCGRVFAIRGNALVDDYGMSILVKSMAPASLDAAAAASALLEAF